MIFIQKKYWVLADQGVFSGTSFISTIIIARNMQPESFGIYSMWILGIYLALSVIGAWSIQPFQVYFPKQKQPKTYITFVFWWFVFIAISALTLTAALLAFFHHILIWPSILFTLGFLNYDLSRKILLVKDSVKLLFFLDLLVSFLTLGLFLKLNKEYSLVNIMLGFSFVYVIVFIISLVILRPFNFKISLFRPYLSYHLKHGKWYFLSAISQWWASNLFVVASGVYLGSVALGALRLSQSLFGVLNVLLQTFENYVLPQTVSKININTTVGLSYLRQMTVKAAWVFLPLLFIIFVFAKQVLSLAGGAQYQNYSFILQGLCFLYVLIYISQPIRCLVRALELNKVFFQGYLFSLAFAFIFSHQILAHFKLYGVIVGLIISQLILIIYWSVMLRIKNNISWKLYI